ncbi:MAG: DUF1801 domain-containing protein [Saprospiraceae bacterium]|nr:DUF1801 domain-containing protein [Saprospiraceae bacterium]
MRYEADTPEHYLEQMPEDRKKAMTELRNVIVKNLPKGFEESIGYGMLGWAVPHSMYPAGYHCKPEDPLPFLGIASQKNFIAVYHMGLYADPELLAWFQEAFPKHSSRKLDMGKSCIRFKNVEHIPFQLIGELASKMNPAQWIYLYETNLKR